MSAQPQFLQGSAGPLFCNYYAAENPRASLLLCPPFGDELNKSRRMLALLCRELQSAGCSVLHLDLHGCGDSAGEHSEARWSQWREDVFAAYHWLHASSGESPALLGFRLGALMALEVSELVVASRLVLWQPVLNGKQFIQQFLRLRLVAGAFSGNKETAADLRAQLDAGDVLEVAGYGLHPEFVVEVENLKVSESLSAPLSWFQLVPNVDKGLPAAQQKRLSNWQETADAELTTVVGEQFWQTPEITEVPGLIDATVKAVMRSCG